MFTGIIEDLGSIKSIRKGAKDFIVEVEAPKLAPKLAVGDSVTVNGICLTVTTKSGTGFTVDVMPETITKTALNDLKKGDKVNLERAMALSSRLGGHMVAGHVDGVGVIKSKKEDSNALLIKISAPDSITHYLIDRGSIAIDGISLTVMGFGNDFVAVSIIPHTAKVTTLGFKKPGDKVNLEADLIGKYVEKFVSKEKEKDSGLTMDKLREHGFA